MSTDYTRRETMQALAALSLFGWGDDDDGPQGLDDLGFFDTHLVANDGEGITIDPELLDFVGAITAEQTDDGVQISIDPDQLELDGLTNPLTDSLDAAGRNITNVKSLDTEYTVSESKPQVDVFIDDTGTYKATGPFDFLPLTNDSDVLELLDAIDNNLTTAAVLHVHGGSYECDNTFSDGGELEITTPGTTLMGDGAATEIFLRDQATATGEGSKLIEVRADDVTLADFKIDGNWQNQSMDEVFGSEPEPDGHNIAIFAKNVDMSGVRSVNSTGDGVEPFSNTENVTITNCIFRNNWEQCIHFNSCKAVTVTNCILDGEETNGLVDTYAGVDAVTEDVTMSNCILRNGNDHGIIVESGEGSVRDVTFENIVVADTAGRGVYVRYNANAVNQPEDITFKNVTCKNCLKGVQVGAGSNIKVEGGNIHDVDEEGVLVYLPSVDADVTIKNIDIRDVGMATLSDGIKANPVDQQLDLTVEDNDIESVATGSAMDNAIGLPVSGTGDFVSGSEIIDNTVAGNGADNAITLDPSSNIKIRHNDGHKTEALISAELTNSDSVNHGLVNTPTHFMLTTRGYGVISSVGSIDGTSISVNLVNNDDDTARSTATPVTIEAKYWPNAG
ncbi:right-handed parallel beta-helix repeat-containing protein [Halomontanus rarus]|uniref:right-handed parallel beta-helix repeat-containing protein n=1 Tax=Halomontanus rarus TaxID=3034020 RepID=UPI00307C72D6